MTMMMRGDIHPSTQLYKKKGPAAFAKNLAQARASHSFRAQAI